MIRRHVHVSCAVIVADGSILAAQRSSTMSLPLKWEFPGGKIHDGETPEECLVRELVEEMGIVVSIGRSLGTLIYHYPDFSVTLYPFICSIQSGDIVLHEHNAMVWLPPERLEELDWAEADYPLISNLSAVLA